jgi:alpha-D-xyloside xylohydrolase
MSGIPFWSNDIGGYRGHPSEALYIRWAQFGLLCSHARCHGESQREPWSFGEWAVKIFRQYAQLRYRLFPYLYSCAHEATNNGLPLLRAMPLSFPNDPNSYDKDLQFMLGPWLLIAPIYSEDGRRSIYLPAGDWVDFWSDAPLTGPLNLDVQPPLEQMPIYVRSGAIIPMMQPALRIPQRSPDPLILEVYLGDPSTYHFYEDEGVTDFRLTAEEDGWAFGWSGGIARKVIMHFHQGRQPAVVKVQALNSGSSQHSQ